MDPRLLVTWIILRWCVLYVYWSLIGRNSLRLSFQWSPFQLSGHRPHNRADRPVIWSHAPWRYFKKSSPLLISSRVQISMISLGVFISAPPSSLQPRRAAVPPQLSRTVLLLPAGLVERSSQIRGEEVWAGSIFRLSESWVSVSSNILVWRGSPDARGSKSSVELWFTLEYFMPSWNFCH